jgi:integrase
MVISGSRSLREGQMSVRKRTWRTSKGEEKTAWIVDYVDRDGDRHIETFPTKKQADAREADVSVNIRTGIHVAASKSETVLEAGEKWIEGAEAAALERATVAQYGQHLRFHIAPFLGSVKLSNLTVPTVREFEDRLRQEGRSPAMVRKVLTSLSSILSDAHERGNVAQNVVRDLRKRRRQGKERQAEKRKKGKLKVGVDIPSPDEIRQIIANAKGRWRPVLITAIFTGLRASELRGLRWADVDFGANEVHVRQRADRYNQFGKPKSAAGERVVPFGKFVANTLREWKLAAKGELVFPNRKGGIESHKMIVSGGFIPAQLAAGITANGKAKYTGLHAVRHFYASWCINRPEQGGLGLPPKAVQERMGHSSITMTMDVYGHLFPCGDDAEELDAAELALVKA